MARFSDPNPGYWQEYGPFQNVKHDLIRCYLGGWFAKLGTWAGRVVYVDTHAGRGRYRSGQPGSPLVALTTFLDHSFRDQLLSKSEFLFLFIEQDDANLAELRRELAVMGTLPGRVHVTSVAGNAFDRLSELLERLRQERAKMAPAFVFVDPYGFKIPGRLLRDLMAAGRVELFINVIWRELDMAVSQRPEPGTGMADTLDAIFDGDDWRREIDGGDVETRMDQAVALLGRKIGARWWTYIRMISGGQATRYLLLHLTNHDSGRDLMKDCMWKVCPHGGFYVLRSEDPTQPRLMEPEPDLNPLRGWALQRLRQGPRRWNELDDELRPEIWRASHLGEVIRALRAEGVIVADGYHGRFSRKANPLLRLRPTE
jgi:three-Cys-motif partner protein